MTKRSLLARMKVSVKRMEINLFVNVTKIGLVIPVKQKVRIFSCKLFIEIRYGSFVAAVVLLQEEILPENCIVWMLLKL